MPLLSYNTVPARAERVYLQAETAFGTIPNSGGTATLAGTNACRHTRVTMTPSIPLMNRRDKTGSLSMTAGIKGRIYGTWEIEMDLTANGAAGTAPDCGVLLNSAFGVAPTSSPTVTITGATATGSVLVCTVSAIPASMQSGQSWVITNVVGAGITSGNTYVIEVLSPTTFSVVGVTASSSYTTVTATAAITGIVYNLSDANYSFDMWSFRNISGATTTNLEQRVAVSCVTTELSVAFGAEFATLTARGDCLCILDDLYYSSASAAEQGGLSAFPAEPSAPVTNGYPSPGFIGVAQFQTGSSPIVYSAIPEIMTGTITLQTGRKLIRDTFGSYTPTGIENAERLVTVAIDSNDTDSAVLAAMKLASKLKTAQGYFIQIGQVAGSIFQFSAANLYLNPPSIEDSNIRFRDRFAASPSFASTYTSKDELSLVVR